VPEKRAVAVMLIDRRNFHLFQPLLYQVATGWLSPANIAATLRATLKQQKEHPRPPHRSDRH
jgi:NADH dehydrogenase